MIIITGGFGFIGSNVIKALNNQGITDILVVDNIEHNSDKFKNLVDCKFIEYIHRDELLKKLPHYALKRRVEGIIHLGACSSTTHPDSQYVIEQNYIFSKHLFDYCYSHNVKFIYASSAAVYGVGQHFIESPESEKPINIYGFSKLMFDNYVRYQTNDFTNEHKNQVVGLRFFNVYGPREEHKNNMASVIYQFNQQLYFTRVIKLFENTLDSKRDFVYIDDVVDVIQHFYEHNDINGLFNVGTGQATTFNDITTIILDYHKKGELKFKDMPPEMISRFQHFTQADLTNLRDVGGYTKEFLLPNEGVVKYLDYLTYG